MKKVLKVFIVCIMSICISLGLVYLGLAIYYENGFSFLTYINGVYCTGKTVENVNDELNDSYGYIGLEVSAREGSFEILTEDIFYTYDFKEPLNHYLNEQNPYLWVENLSKGKKEYTLLPQIYYDEVIFNSLFYDNINKFNLPKSHEVKIALFENGFTLVDTKQNILDVEKAKQVITNALVKGETSVNLEEEGCYYNESYTKQEQDLREFYNKLELYQNKKVTYFLGEDKETFSKLDLAKTLTCFDDISENNSDQYIDYSKDFLDENGSLSVNEEMVNNLLDEKLNPYNTYRNHFFTTHDNRQLQIKGGTYGNQIAMKTEKKELLSFLESDDVSYSREPEYSKEFGLKGKDDIGNTYIEVDIGNQKMYYYRDGELYLETDVVTGKNKATREEVCYVYSKQRNRTLRGPGYASFVKFWMPVSGGIGIHDASWRSEYGGDIYIRNGSHGCINTPHDIVEKMYEVVEIGTPCILYYGLDETE